MSLFPLSILLISSLVLGCATAVNVGDNDGGKPDSTGPNFQEEADAKTSTPDLEPISCAEKLEELFYDFEVGTQGFIHAPMPAVADSTVKWVFDHWETGEASSICPIGDKCWGTNLDDNYVQCQRGYLQSPTIDLSACAGKDVRLQFEHYYDFWSATLQTGTWSDGGLVEISEDGVNWKSANIEYPGVVKINPIIDQVYCVENDNYYIDKRPGFVGSSAGWLTQSITIPAALVSSQFKIRFVYSSGVSSMTLDQDTSMKNTAPGWYLDKIRFEEI